MARKQEVFGVDVNGDITGLKKAMNDAVRLFNSTERSLKSINKAVELNPTDDRLLDKQRDAYKLAIKENEEALRKLQKVRNAIVNDPNFKKGVTDMKEKFASVDLEIEKVRAEGEKLRKELKSLPTNEIAKLEDKFKKFKESVEKSKEAIERIHSSLKNINDQIKLDPTNIDLYTRKTTLLNDELRATEGAMYNIEKRQDALKNTKGFLLGKDDYRKEWTENALLLEQYRKRAEELRAELDRQLSPAMERFLNLMGRTGTHLQELSRNTRALSIAFQGLATSAVASAMDYESNIANIRRVVKDLSDNTIQDLKDIAVETGNAFKDISEYATIGGALGLAESDISKFTKTMIDLNTATGGVFAGEEGAKGIAVFLKQLNLGIDEAENFGSAIAVIGDKYADIGDETVNVATRLTGLSSIISTNQYELIGLAGVMADLGLATDSNANGINRAFLQIDKVIGGGVKNSTEKLEEMARVAGMTSAEFVQAWGTDAVDTFLKFTDGLKSSVFNDINYALANSTEEVKKYADVLGLSADQFERLWKSDSSKAFDMYVTALGEMNDEGVVASKVLGDLGIASVNTAQTLLRLAGNGNEVRKAIKLTEDAWNQNTALTEKSSVIYETTAYKLKGLWESLKQLGATLGNEIIPNIKDFADKATVLSKQFSKLSPTLKKLVINFVGLGAAISPVTGIIGKLLDPSKGIPFFIHMLNGPGGLAVAIGAITIAGIEAMSQIRTSVTSFDELTAQTRKLNDEFVRGLEIADKNYESQIRSLDGTHKYAEAIDRVVEKLKDQNLSEEEQARLKDILRDYIDKLNTALGNEAFYFDETTGKITNQGVEIEKVSKKFDELAAKYKQEAWLETHKQSLNDAYQILDESSGKLDSATEDYLNQMSAFPPAVRQAFEETAGTLKEAKEFLIENGFADIAQNFDLEEAEKIFEHYKTVVQETQTIVDNANSVIDSYMLVAEGNLEMLDTHISMANDAIEVMKTGTVETEESLDHIQEKRDAYASTLTEEQKVNDELLKKYDEQIAKIQTMNTYAQTLEGLYQQSKSTVGELINEMESYTPSDKYVHFYAIYHDFGNENIYGGRVSRSGGFGFNSYGYGDLLKNTMSSVRSSLGNFNSGGFRSGGINVVNNFTVNSNNIGRREVQSWSSWIIDDINEALGKQM